MLFPLWESLRLPRYGVLGFEQRRVHAFAIFHVGLDDVLSVVRGEVLAEEDAFPSIRQSQHDGGAVERIGVLRVHREGVAHAAEAQQVRFELTPRQVLDVEVVGDVLLHRPRAKRCMRDVGQRNHIDPTLRPPFDATFVVGLQVAVSLLGHVVETHVASAIPWVARVVMEIVE